MRRISTLQPIHLYNLEPIICGSNKVSCSALLKFHTYICVYTKALPNLLHGVLLEDFFLSQNHYNNLRQEWLLNVIANKNIFDL